MDFSLSDDQLLLRDTVRQFMEAELRPVVRQNDRGEISPAARVARVF
jgi:alkylation response protein AidB-like acyl-CoA dehydrogenase